MNTPSDTARNAAKVRDPVRIFHWPLAAFFTIACLTAEEESPFHNIAGYVVPALIGIRLLWGFIGTRHARFSVCIYGPGTVLRYARDPLAGRANRYLGHNPLGGIMVIALLISISATGVSGWALQRAEDDEHTAAAPAVSLVALSPIAPAYADGQSERHEHQSSLGGLRVHVDLPVLTSRGGQP